MIRLALPKGRIREAALAAFGVAGVEVEKLDPETRALSTRLNGGEAMEPKEVERALGSHLA